MKPSPRLFETLVCALQFGLASIAAAHGHDDNTADSSIEHHMSLNQSIADAIVAGPPSYFHFSDHSAAIFAHIILMCLAWIFVLPLGVMLSIARSRLGLIFHLSFLVLNGLGVLLATIYNTKTPDLYLNNAHHTLGWLLTCVVCAQTFLAFLYRYTCRVETIGCIDERNTFIPMSTEAIEEHGRIHSLRNGPDHRFSDDSGQGTERNTESLRSQSLSSIDRNNENLDFPLDRRYEVGVEPAEKDRLLSDNAPDKLFLKKLPSLISSRILHVLVLIYEIVNRLILILGFIALVTGIVTYGGIFQGGEIFSGLAHFIKGGVFFWYGILTLGRWAGCFADIGWAWNINPSGSVVGWHKASIPSAEFVESFLIFLYGSTNVFLEHLGSWGGAWSATDLEHLSITIMFFGGGLCGMLIESKRIRCLLNATIAQGSAVRNANVCIIERDNASSWQPPKTYEFSMNPLPALTILLLGFMMSSHHQASMVSTMIHAQWGALLIGAASARAVTYIIFYLSPPASLLPSRPPSELITAFCLMAGGIMFMASSHDTILAMELNDIDAMFAFTVAMGLVTFLMAWIILVIAVKGWAFSREHGLKPEGVHNV